MRVVFADMGYWIALLNPADDLHDRALAVTQQLLPMQIVTTDAVLVELLNGFSGRGDRLCGVAVRLIESLQVDPTVEVVSQATELFNVGLRLYGQRLDKNWSHTDCVSFCVMNDRRIVEALAYDHHFEQAGFVALLRD